MSDSLAGIAPGTMLGGFRIERMIGRGGMGLVYVAEQVALGRRVALKLIAPELAASPEFQARFERESRMAAAIDHPNVVPLYEAGQVDGVHYIATRFIDGTDLRALIAAEGRLRPATAAHAMAQVGGALDAAHALGLVHRDVKPANILVADPGGAMHCYLTDFGLTKHTTSHGGMTGTGQWVGTLDYVAPEQVAGDRVDARADVYALGCVLFQAVTGSVPFPRDSDIAKLYAHVHEPPPRPTSVAAGLPPDLDGVVTRALAKEPGDRYPSAGDLVRATQAAVADAPVEQPERSVASGPAAPAGPTEPARSNAGTRLEQAPQRHFEPAPAPPAGWTPVTQPLPQRHGSGGIAIALIVAALLLAGAGVAAALIVTGSNDSNGSQQTAERDTPPADTGGSDRSTGTETEEPQPPPAPKSGDLEPYSASTYSAKRPAGWSVVQDDEEQTDGRRVSKWSGPDGSTLLIDTTLGIPPSDPGDSAGKLERGESQTAGYERLAFEPFTSGGDPAFEWAFKHGPTGTYRVDMFVFRGGNGYAVLGVAPTRRKLNRIRPLATQVLDSIEPY